MKTCLCCGTISSDETATCPACGEASWGPSSPTPVDETNDDADDAPPSARAHPEPARRGRRRIPSPPGAGGGADVPVYVKPPAAARVAAKRALEIRASLPSSKKGGLDTKQAGEQKIGSGVARARDIAAGKRVNASQVSSFLARNEPNVKKARAQGKGPTESKAVQAHGLWGGSSMKRAADSALRASKRGK